MSARTYTDDEWDDLTAHDPEAFDTNGDPQ